MKNACLFITDHYLSKVNGISLFSQNLIKNHLKNKYEGVVVYELYNKELYYINTEKGHFRIVHIYANAHYSASDDFLRKIITNLELNPFGFELALNLDKTIISHGWVKIDFRNHYYYYYYNFKNLKKSKNLDRIKFYDRIMFISNLSDNYRHKDFTFAKSINMPVEFFDFKTKYIESLREKGVARNTNIQDSYVLVIANLELVKNTFSIFYSKKLKSIMKEKKIQKIIVLSPKSNKTIYKLFRVICNYFSVEIVNDNSMKMNLLENCSSLFIPSITEYLPLVSLEAMAFKKEIYSLYEIKTLKTYPRYRVLLK